AFYCLVLATYYLAVLTAPAGRAQIVTAMIRQGMPASMQTEVLVTAGMISIGIPLVAAALHGAAFHGLRRQRRWGWIAAVVVAAVWSLLLVGIPVLVRLLNRDVRHSFGVD